MSRYVDHGEMIHDTETSLWIPKSEGNSDYDELIESGVEFVLYEPEPPTLDVQTGTSAWTEAEFKRATELGDGWREKTFEVACNMPETRIKIILSGDPSGRPRARALRAVVLDA